MTVDIWIRDYNPPRCFQKKISGRSKHNVVCVNSLKISELPMRFAMSAKCGSRHEIGANLLKSTGLLPDPNGSSMLSWFL
jgi:hypothetical protein